jgi:hypothetical protein
LVEKRRLLGEKIITGFPFAPNNADRTMMTGEASTLKEFHVTPAVNPQKVLAPAAPNGTGPLCSRPYRPPEERWL